MIRIAASSPGDIPIFSINWEETKTIEGVQYHRHPKGGGWVSKTANVAPTAFVGRYASVHDEAQVFDSAKVYDNACVCDKATVYGKALVYGNARVCNVASVYDNAQVHGNAIVSGDARVFGKADVFGDAVVLDFALIYEDAVVYGNARVCDRARVHGNARLYDYITVHSHVTGDVVNNSGKRCDIVVGEIYFVKVHYKDSSLWAMVEALRVHSVQGLAGLAEVCLVSGDRKTSFIAALGDMYRQIPKDEQ